MNSPMPPAQYLLLSLADHPLASQEAHRHDGAPGAYIRCLNVAGRWAVHGTTHTPLLVWHATQASAAHAAGERASRARNCPVEVVSRGDAGGPEGRQIQLFTDAFESALLGSAARSEARSRRLRNEADRLAAFSLIVRAASTAADQEAFAEVSRAAAKALRTKFGGGSITSTFAWLAGQAGRDALESVLAGEVELTGPLSLREVVEAAELAQKAERLREES
ncbi:hypothetical protein QTI24_25075 [Variovorax sp. J22P240]|uniref:hypothetical protein n=1 Tax=Variovorax sp. J22P240 TaxID=3053514 RepID=UPI002575B045|nr:hypothetical protein [Variovorax sp. J22P240]MDM0001903.1 hypothetical protein [Variovorax sp. J22P240]